jgi:hypothetical protein
VLKASINTDRLVKLVLVVVVDDVLDVEVLDWVEIELVGGGNEVLLLPLLPVLIVVVLLGGGSTVICSVHVMLQTGSDTTTV